MNRRAGVIPFICPFQQEVMSLMVDVFDFKKVRYTTVEQMAEDIFGLSQLTVDKIAQRLGI